jgi:hypothetical protein
MPNFRLSSNPAKPILVQLSAIHSLKKYPHSYAKIVLIKEGWEAVEEGRDKVEEEATG